MIHSENHEQGTLILTGGKIIPGNSGSDAICQEIIRISNGEKIALISAESQENPLSSYLLQLGAKNINSFLFDTPEKANSIDLCAQLDSFSVLLILESPKSAYFHLWKQSLLIQTIQNVYQNGKIVVGEASGASILGEISFFYKNGTLHPANLFKNPFIQSLILEENFIPLVPNSVIDTDFNRSDSFLKLIPLMARCAIQKSKRVKSIAIDAQTALIIDANSIGQVIGDGQVNMLIPTPKSQVRFEFPKPPEYTHLNFYQIPAGSKFILNDLEMDFCQTLPSEMETKPKFTLPGNPLVFFGKNHDESTTQSGNRPISQGIKLLCQEVGNLTILSGEQFHELALEFSNSLRHICHSDLAAITLSDNKHEYEIQTSQIKKSTGIILVGNNLEYIINYLRSGNPVAKAFRSRLNAGIPLGLVGSAIQLAGRWILQKTANDLPTESAVPTIDGLNYIKGSILMPNLTTADQEIGKKLAQFFQALHQKTAKLGILLDSDCFVFLNERRNLTFCGTPPTILIDQTSLNNSEGDVTLKPRGIVHLVHDDFEFDLRNYELHSVTKGPANSI
ncbi:hypothetical protein JW964_02370 [candidate division KSB1 bacterium]|nr:hypothetical protein [candidate division KSB1 bacterium]